MTLDDQSLGVGITGCLRELRRKDLFPATSLTYKWYLFIHTASSLCVDPCLCTDVLIYFLVSRYNANTNKRIWKIRKEYDKNWYLLQVMQLNAEHFPPFIKMKHLSRHGAYICSPRHCGS